MFKSITSKVISDKSSMIVFCKRKTSKALCLLLAFCLFQPNAYAEFNLSGKATQGGLLVGKTEPTNKVLLDNNALSVSTKGDYVFGFGRDDSQEHKLEIIFPNGKRIEKLITPTTREFNIQRVEGIPKAIMNPKPEDVARAKIDSQQVAQARSVSSDLISFSQGFIAPIEGIVTGVYGSQRFYNGKPNNPHYGIDYAGKTGDPVKAPADGIVLLWVPDMFYSGGTMIIDHGHGVTSSFLHLSGAFVKAGDNVKQGQIVASVGKSGRATGPHLDWRINWFSTKIDPALVLQIKPIKE